jgi:hypothetical protein
MERMFVISNDAYIMVLKIEEGFSPLGVDDGTKKARALDMEIIEKCLVNEISTKKSKKHLQNTPYKKYGLQRNINGYGVVVICAFGVSFANKLNQALYNKP